MMAFNKPPPGLPGARIDWKDATVLSSDNENGLRLIPAQLPDGTWVAMIWRMTGEFERYEGLRRL